MYVTVWGDKYQKAGFVGALNAIGGIKLKATATDSAIIKAVNKLSDAEQTQLKADAATYKQN